MFSYDVESREIFVHDEIGPSWAGLIDAGQVREALTAIGRGGVKLRINSPGGQVDEACAIYNVLRDYKGEVTVVVDSLAASAASYIAQVGHRRLMAPNSAMMIHSPWTACVGNAEALMKEARLLNKYADRMARGYAERTAQDLEEIERMMAAETWFDADEAVDSGFADGIAEYSDDFEPVGVGALQRIAKRVPEALKLKTARTQLAKAKIAAVQVETYGI